MIIETKFNIDDTAFFIMQNAVYSAKITGIDIKVGKNERTIYDIDKNPCGARYTDRFSEYELFKTKEELLQTL